MRHLSRLTGFVLLAATGLTGCHRSAQSLPASGRPVELTGETADWADKRRQGIDFVAGGSAPTSGSATPPATWQLTIDFSKRMQFRIPNGPELLTPVPKPQPSPGGLGVVLDSRSTPLYASNSRRIATRSPRTNDRNRLSVVIEPVTYRDPLTKRDYAYTVRVEANGKPYVGGGTFIKAANRLQGTWTVETFRGQRLRAGQFGDKALPVLAFDLKKGRLTGSTGWHKLKGSVQAAGDRLTIDPHVGSHQPKPGSLEADFVESLRQSSLFRVGKNRVTLLVNGQYVMTLRRP